MAARGDDRESDVLTWQPERRFQAWQDRAVIHFLTTTQARQLYMATLQAATTAGTAAVFGCFAPDGPQYCSGLPVSRYDPNDLRRELCPHGCWWPRPARNT